MSHTASDIDARLSGRLDDSLAGRLPDAATAAAADARARRRLSPDPGRPRPTTMPALARFAHVFLRAPKRMAPPAARMVG